MACVALVVSAAAVIGVKAYNYYSMPELMRTNLEALSQDEQSDAKVKIDCQPTNDEKDVCIAYCTRCFYPHFPSQHQPRYTLSSAAGNCTRCKHFFRLYADPVTIQD